MFHKRTEITKHREQSLSYTFELLGEKNLKQSFNQAFLSILIVLQPIHRFFLFPLVLFILFYYSKVAVTKTSSYFSNFLSSPVYVTDFDGFRALQPYLAIFILDARALLSCA